MSNEHKDNTELEQDDWVSKSEKKRNNDDIQEIARSLLKLSDSQRKKLLISEELNDAILLAIKIKNSKEGFRRQMQLVIKILRQDNVEETKAAMENLASRNTHSDAASIELEAIRSDMLKNGDEAVNAFIEKNPMAERQKLRQLIRQANKEAKLEKPSKAAKELFRYIKSFIH